MASVLRFAAVFAAGVISGGAGIAALHAAEAQTAPAWVVANIASVHDQAMYDKYRAGVTATQTPFGGKVVARTKAVKLDESTPPEGNVLLIKFPSMKALQSWWNSPAYAAIKPLRENATKSVEYALEGLPPS
jgi:uncharacterized protein (DUF1330 family)